MDRRMYRGNMGNNCGCSKSVPPYRSPEPVCGDLLGGYSPDNRCDKPDNRCDRDERKQDSCFDRSDRFPIGMCYVPWQEFCDLFENEFVALKNGTLFKELDLNWYGRGCK